MGKTRKEYDEDGVKLTMRTPDYLADMSGQMALGIMGNLVGQMTYFYTDKVGMAVGAVGFGNKVGGGIGSLLLSLFLMLGSYDASLAAASASMRWSIYGFSNYFPVAINLLMFFIFLSFDLEAKLPALREEVASRRT